MASPRPPGARKPRRRQQVKLTVGEAKATVLDKLEQFLSRHSASEDLGLRLDGEQLAAGVRFVRIVREGSYDVVVGNPPYQGLGKTSFSGYVAKHYPRGKADLYAAFLERGLELTREGGLSALLTMRGWMFLGQFKELRQNVLGSRYCREGCGHAARSMPLPKSPLVVTKTIGTHCAVKKRRFYNEPDGPRDGDEEDEEEPSRMASIMEAFERHRKARPQGGKLDRAAKQVVHRSVRYSLLRGPARGRWQSTNSLSGSCAH